MKRLLAFGIALLTLVLAPAVTGAAEAPRSPLVLLDGLPLQFDVPAQIIDSRTMVPFRAIAEALGVTVNWDPERWSIQAFGPNEYVFLQIGEKVIYVNGVPQELDVPPLILGGRTLVPLRAFSAAFGAQVGWDEATFTVAISSPVRPMRMLGFYALGSFPNRHLVPTFSDVTYGWARLNADGTVNLQGRDYFWPEPAGDVTPETLLADAAAAGSRRFLLVHEVDHDLRLTNLVLNEERIARAAEAISAVIAEKGFDGVHLDLEGLGLSETGEELERVRQGFVRLVTAVSDRLRPAGKQTLVSLPPLNGWYHGYDYAALAPVVDAIHIMAHHFLEEEGEPEPADQVEAAIRAAVTAVGAQDRSKLILGMLRFETPETLVQKVGLAKRHNIGGIAFWTIGGLTPEQLQALQRTVVRRP